MISDPADIEALRLLREMYTNERSRRHKALIASLIVQQIQISEMTKYIILMHSLMEENNKMMMGIYEWFQRRSSAVRPTS